MSVPFANTAVAVPLQIISEKMTPTGGTIIVQGPTQESVVSGEARAFILQHASQRIAKAGLSNNPPPYPVDADGKSDSDLILGRNGKTVAGYRADYRVTGMI